LGNELIDQLSIPQITQLPTKPIKRTMKTIKIILILQSFLFIPAFAQNNGVLANIDSTSDYLVYYDYWSNDLIQRAQYFDLVILDGSGITGDGVLDIRNGLDNILNTEDDVIVVAYLSIGEDNQGNRDGDGSGPVRWENDQLLYTNAGYASWYVDDMNKDSKPDQNGVWGSYYVNAGDSAWHSFVKTNADNLLVTLGCDGLFLDTIDTASPWFHYRWTAQGMSQLIELLCSWYPQKYLIANRGIFYFDPAQIAYQFNIRPFINAVMFECYYLEWNWDLHVGEISPYFSNNKNYWAGRINTEANKTDGFTVLSLDYLNPSQPDYQTLLENQIYETVERQGWTNYISSIYLNEIRYDMYHQHEVDENPPSWQSSIGLQLAISEDDKIRLHWNKAIDQSEPIKYNLYYATDIPFDFSSADKLADIAKEPSSKDYDYQFTIDGLNPLSMYYVAIRAEDSAPQHNEDQNKNILTATTLSDTTSVSINIDGNFDDWINVPQMDVFPNAVENTGDAVSDDADLLDVWAFNDEDYLFLRYQVAGTIGGGSHFYQIYLDVDEDNNTGYSPSGNSATGAEFLIENSYLWQYTGSGGEDWQWSGPIAGLKHAKNGSNAEVGVPLNIINEISENERTNILFCIYDHSSVTYDWAPDDFTNDTYSYSYYPSTAVHGDQQDFQKVTFQLKQNYPNPFNQSTVFNFSIGGQNEQHVQLKIYAVDGSHVATLINRHYQPGEHYFKWNSENINLATGVYVYQLKVAGFSRANKLLLVMCKMKVHPL